MLSTISPSALNTLASVREGSWALHRKGDSYSNKWERKVHLWRRTSVLGYSIKQQFIFLLLFWQVIFKKKPVFNYFGINWYFTYSTIAFREWITDMLKYAIANFIFSSLYSQKWTINEACFYCFYAYNAGLKSFHSSSPTLCWKNHIGTSF